MVYTPVEQILIDNPATMPEICAHVVAGGQLGALCDTWNLGKPEGQRVRYGAIWAWICEDQSENGRFAQFVASQEVVMRADEHRLAGLYRAVAFGDVRGFFEEDGSLKPVSSWPADLAQMVQGLDLVEMFEKGEDGKQALVGMLKKIKMTDRLKAASQLEDLRGLKRPARVEHSGRVTLEELVSGAGKA